jgi:3'-phosphoadenosine 5'-phosphosulfate sulfotransferase (PAPS reductase)/FAD synthetase
MVFVTGVRKQESARRMGHVEPIQVRGREIWVSPCTNWTKDDVLDTKQYYHLPNNPVVDLTHKSGECLCGSYAHVGELEEIRTWYPEVAEYIDELEQKVWAAGFHWRWEEGPTKEYLEKKRGQQSLWPDEVLYLSEKAVYKGFSPLCSSCHAFQEQREDEESGCPFPLEKK